MIMSSMYICPLIAVRGEINGARRSDGNRTVPGRLFIIERYPPGLCSPSVRRLDGGIPVTGRFRDERLHKNRPGAVRFLEASSGHRTGPGRSTDNELTGSPKAQ